MSRGVLVRAAVMVFVASVAGLEFQGARVVSIATCQKVLEPGTVAANPTDRFPWEAAEIHAVVVLDGAKAGMKVKGSWVSVDAVDTPNYAIKSAEVVVKNEGETRVHFSITKDGWPAGNYRIDVYVDGRLVSTAEFSIAPKATTAAPKSGTASPKSLGSVPETRQAPVQPPASSGPSVARPRQLAPPSPLAGSWEMQTQAGPMILEFRAGGTMVFNGEQARYSVAGNTLRIQDDTGAVDYGYALSGGVLVLALPDGRKLQFTRPGQGGQGQQGGVYGYGGQQQPGHGGQGYPGQGYPGQQGGTGYGGQMGGSGTEYQLRGNFCAWSGSSGGGSGYSRTRWAQFDGQGRFTYGSESSFSGSAGMAYGGSGAGNSGTYRVQGDTIVLMYSDGSSDSARVYNRAGDGTITEVQYDGTLWAPQLCE